MVKNAGILCWCCTLEPENVHWCLGVGAVGLICLIMFLSHFIASNSKLIIKTIRKMKMKTQAYVVRGIFH